VTAPVGRKQTLVIRGWHPPNTANGSQTNRYTRQKNKKAAETVVWASAKHAGWKRVEGRARLTVTLVYARTYRMDTDNLYARCKPICDGLKEFIVDDSRQWLDLRVDVAVRPGAEKATELTLEEN
jgi:Holliday junction resolvase RusA-like endonuclease